MFEENQELYAEMSVPFETPEEAEKVVTAFNEKVVALRKQYRIAEVVLLTQVYVADGENINAYTAQRTLGNAMESIRLAHNAAFGTSIQVIGELNEITQQKLIDNGYRKFDRTNNYADCLFQKKIWHGETLAFFSNIYLYAREGRESYSAEFQFYLKGDSFCDITLSVFKTIEEAEAFANKFYKDFNCLPYEN